PVSPLTSLSVCYYPLCLLFLSSLFSPAPATTVLYTLSLHDALPISRFSRRGAHRRRPARRRGPALNPGGSHQFVAARASQCNARSEEHTSELQSRFDLVCRLLLEKKKKKYKLHQ